MGTWPRLTFSAVVRKNDAFLDALLSSQSVMQPPTLLSLPIGPYLVVDRFLPIDPTQLGVATYHRPLPGLGYASSVDLYPVQG